MIRAVLHDLATTGDSRRESCEVCIVGAGAAGSLLARRLWERGLDVVLLEAGGRAGGGAVESGFAPEFAASPYPGAIEGRFFGLGGSTSAWGGLLVPHSRHDLRDESDPAREQAWRHIVGVTDRRAPSLLRFLGFSQGPDFEAFAHARLGQGHAALEAAGLSAVASVFLPFRRKNLFHLLDGIRLPGPAPRVYTHAVAKDWGVGGDGRVRSCRAVSPDAGRLEVHAGHFVLAAGTIECARILLEIGSSLPGDLELSPEIGACLGDHLSVAIADVESGSLAEVARRYAPRFSGPWMRSFRFMESDPPRGAPRGFAHFVFDNRNPGFELAKKVLGALQARRLPRFGTAEALRGLDGVLRLATARYLRSKLFVPADTATRLQLDVEQLPDPRNRVRLGAARDAFDRRVAQIDWRIGDRDMERLRASADRLLAGWEGQSGRLPRLVRRDLELDSEKPHDAYHPVGVCRMGPDAGAVVDLELRVRGLANLSLASTAVLPSAGTANPTFTMLCLAEELAERLAAGRQAVAG